MLEQVGAAIAGMMLVLAQRPTSQEHHHLPPHSAGVLVPLVVRRTVPFPWRTGSESSFQGPVVRNTAAAHRCFGTVAGVPTMRRLDAACTGDLHRCWEHRDFVFDRR